MPEDENQYGDSGADQRPTHLTLTYKETIFNELDGLVTEGTLFDGLLIDMMQTGFSIQLDTIRKFVLYGKKLLKQHGIMLFVKSDGAIALTRDDPRGSLVINVFDSPYGALILHPAFASHACATVAGIDQVRLIDGGGTLANHILLSSIPVLTTKGKEAKSEFTLPASQNWLVQLIDDYSPVESILTSMQSRHRQLMQESLIILQELENARLIFPIFSRIQFLSNCYQSRKPFRLGHYMVAAGIISEPELKELLEQQQEEGWGDSQRNFLGILAVRADHINVRELQVLLADQYLYGGYHRLLEKTIPGENQGLVDVNTVRDSMIGSLGAIDPPGLLQSLNTSSKTGLLTSEDRDRILLVAFDDGRAVAAKMNELKGFDALVEFITIWKDGIFVFRDKGIASELDESTSLNANLDRILLDSALFGDNINQILSSFVQGRDTVLERVSDFPERWQNMKDTTLHFMDESPVSNDDRIVICDLVGHIDGLSTLAEIVASNRYWPSHKVIKAIDLLAKNNLLVHQKGSLFKPLTVFQAIVAQMKELVGSEANKVLLHSSLHYVHGDSQAKLRFQIDQEGCVSINLNQLKATGVSASVVFPELRQWMEAYLAYCRQEVDPQTIDQMVKKTIQEST